ncbi:MAG: hypothetical protein QXF96_07685 [Saccharolobus sp.]
MMRKEILIAIIISIAIAVAILSLPDILEPIAHKILTILGTYWALAIFIIGLIHGIKPDEHTWPITISYALMQKQFKYAIVSTAIFTTALTLVWTMLSALTSEIYSFLANYNLDPYVDVIVGLTMISVSIGLLLMRKSEVSQESVRGYKVIWVHGLAAAFGGDFIVVLLLTLALTPIVGQAGFLIGLLFGIGSFVSQAIIVGLTYKGAIKALKRDFSVMERAGKFSLLFLGIFMIFLGIYSFMTGG